MSTITASLWEGVFVTPEAAWHSGQKYGPSEPGLLRFESKPEHSVPQFPGQNKNDTKSCSYLTL